MDYFYIIVVVVAVICLILCLSAVGIALQTQGKTDAFPRLQAICPDGWAVGTTNCQFNDLNPGSIDTTSATVPMGVNASNVWSAGFERKATATICDKRKWALQNGVKWDGISNYNQCS